MKASTAELKKHMQNVKISELEDVMDDMSDLLEDSNEISEVPHISPFSQHCGFRVHFAPTRTNSPALH